MKYVIVYNDKGIEFEGEVPDNTITYYNPKTHYCKVLSTEEEKDTEIARINDCITSKTIDEKFATSNYPKDTKLWTETVADALIIAREK